MGTWFAGTVLALAALRMPGPAATAAPDEVAEVVPVEGEVQVGRLGAVTPEGVHLQGLDAAAGGTVRRWAPGEVREIRWPRPEVPEGPAPTLRVTLAAGGVLHGTFGGAAEDGFALLTSVAGRIALPFEATRSIEALPEDGGPCHDAAARHPAAPEGDRIYVRSGDAYTGVITEAGAAGLSIETARGTSRVVPWGDLLVAHVQGEPGGATAPGEAALWAEVETVDGSVFATAAYPEGDVSGLAFTLRAAPAVGVRVPGHQILRVRTHAPRFAYASELPWSGRHVPYYGAAEGADGEAGGTSLLERWFAPRADRRPSGCPLRVGGVEHRRGFGVYAKTSIEVALDGAWSTFETSVGIDDEVLVEGAAAAEGAPRGDVDVRILGDGRVLWEAKGVKGGEAPRSTGSLDVRGVRVLGLEVGFGGDMNARDQADWLSPLLTRPAPAAPR